MATAALAAFQGGAGADMAQVKRVPGPAAAPLERALAGLKGFVGKVGWFNTAKYPDGTPVAYVAAVQEFGYPEGNIPPRLGMRSTSAEKRGEWGAVAGKASQAVLTGKSTGPQAMEVLGLKAAGDMRKHIAEVTTPPLKVNTVKARLAGKKQGKVVSVTVAKPLVDTGHMLATLTNVVEKE